MSYHALSDEKKKQMALAAWRFSIEEYEEPAAWNASELMLVNINWLLHCEHITDDLLRETFFNAVRSGASELVNSLLICGRDNAFNGDIVGTALHTAAVLNKWRVVAMIEATDWYEEIPDHYKTLTNSLRPRVANDAPAPVAEEPDAEGPDVEVPELEEDL